MRKQECLRLISILALIFLSPVCKGQSEKKEDSAAPSWVALATNPDRYHDKRVHVYGWLTVRKTGGRIVAKLFLTREAHDYMDSTLMIALDEKTLMAQRDIGEEHWLAMTGERVHLYGRFLKSEGEGSSIPKLVSIEHFMQTKPGQWVWPGK